MDKFKNIDKLLAALSEGHQAVKDRGTHMYLAYDQSMYGMDLLAGAALNRTLANIDAFTHLIKSRNLVIAGALLRIQIDTALRFFAAFLVQDPHGFALKVLGGERIDTQKDMDGNRLTDRYLVEMITKDFPWVDRVYKTTSGYIHLSGTHIYHTISSVGDDKAFRVKLSPKDKDLPDALYMESIEAFIESINILLEYVDGWIYTKSNPEKVAEARARIENDAFPKA